MTSDGNNPQTTPKVAPTAVDQDETEIAVMITQLNFLLERMIFCRNMPSSIPLSRFSRKQTALEV